MTSDGSSPPSSTTSRSQRAPRPPARCPRRHAPERVLQRLDWQVVRRLDGLLQGDYRSLFHGAGVDLAALREYQPGDDVRYIDWNVTARMDVPYVRELPRGPRDHGWFLLDLSPSVDFGTAEATAGTSGACSSTSSPRWRGSSPGAATGWARSLYATARRAAHPGARRPPPGAPAHRGAASTSPAWPARRTPTSRRCSRRALRDDPAPLARRRRLRLHQPAGLGGAARASCSGATRCSPSGSYDPREVELPDVGPVILEDAETGERSTWTRTTPASASASRRGAGARGGHRGRPSAGGRGRRDAVHGRGPRARHRADGLPPTSAVRGSAVSFLWPWMLALARAPPAGLARVSRHRRRRRGRIAALGAALGAAVPAPGPSRLRGRVGRPDRAAALDASCVALARPQARCRCRTRRARSSSPSTSPAAWRPPTWRPRASTWPRRSPTPRGGDAGGVLMGVVAFSDAGLAVHAAHERSGGRRAAIDRLGPALGTSLGEGMLAALDAIAEVEAQTPAEYYSNARPSRAPAPVEPGSTVGARGPADRRREHGRAEPPRGRPLAARSGHPGAHRRHGHGRRARRSTSTASPSTRRSIDRDAPGGRARDRRQVPPRGRCGAAGLDLRRPAAPARDARRVDRGHRAARGRGRAAAPPGGLTSLLGHGRLP